MRAGHSGGQNSRPAGLKGLNAMRLRIRRRGDVGTGVIAALVMIGSVGLAAPAAAEDPSGRAAAAERALDGLGLLTSLQRGRSSDTAGATGELNSTRGLVVGVGESEMSIRPMNDGLGTLSPSGKSMIYSDSSSHSVALTGKSTSADAGYVVVNDASAPESYDFELTANGAPAILELSEGRVYVKDFEGNVVNMISPAWAVDAAGNEVATTYSVDGSVLTQRVEHRGARYPVVADPRVACSGLFCTLELTKRETAQLADNALNAGVVCGITGPAVVLCTAAVIAGWAQANVARNTGQCFGTRWANYPLPNNFHNVYVRCYA